MDWRVWLTVVALTAFNLPTVYAAFKSWNAKAIGPTFSAALKEKAPDGSSTDAVSYSRVSGAVGAIMLGSLFWIISNIVIAYAILSPETVGDILGSVGKLFLIGSALFLPYAFNQLKSVLQ